MKRIAWILAPLLISALAAPVVLAGEGGKCPLGTQECLDAMAKKMKSKGWLGVEIKDQSGHMEIVKVLPEGPAEKAGIAAGDVIIAVNGVEYAEANLEKLSAIREEMSPGNVFTFTVLKAATEKEDIQITLGTIPEDIMAQWIGKHMLEHVSTQQAE